MDIKLKKATEEDLQTILTILNHAVKNKLSRGDVAWGMNDIEPEPIRQMIKEGKYYLAYDGDTTVGTCALSWQDSQMWGDQQDDAAYVQRFATAAGHKGEGVGARMLDLLIIEVTNAGKKYLRIAVPSGNPKLRLYYEVNGFVRADHRVQMKIHPAFAAVYYERPTEVTGSGDQAPARQKTSFFGRLKNPLRGNNG